MVQVILYLPHKYKVYLILPELQIYQKIKILWKF